MTQNLGSVALLVRDYDEAIAWYIGVLGFELLQDSAQPPGKRWVRIAPPGSRGSDLLLARAVGDGQVSLVGKQMGGRVGFFLHTDDFARDHRAMHARGVHFIEEPRIEAYGTVAVFEDLYGNRWDLLELTP